MGHVAFRLVLCICALAAAVRASAAETDELRDKQRAQEKARVLATDLVSGILDVQLRQLKENNLRHLPIYGEIKSMRGNIDELVENEMQEVVGLLVKAQEGDRDARLESFNKARDVIREVVVALMAERQKLLKRLQVARIAAQVRQLISLQSEALQATRALPTKTAEAREPLTLTTIQDQRDITALFYQLVATLEDVSTWSGPIATGAADGLRILTTAQVEPELKHAGEYLKASNFDDSATSQQAVVKGLRALLKIIEQTQGLIGADREAALKFVRDMIEKQDALREATRGDPLNDDLARDDFASRQGEIKQELATLAETLSEYPETEPLLEQSRAAAVEAEARLFNGEQTDALLQQGQVIGGLAEIESQLGEALDPDSVDKTADELAAEVQRLEQLDKALDTALTTQRQATGQAAKDARAAAQHEARVDQQLDQADKLGEFTRGIESRLDDAQDAVAAANKVLQNTVPEAAPTRQRAAERAENVLRQASAEVKSELGDTRRRQMAVEVGELARAAEALERAAASEREIARAADHASKFDGLTEEQATALDKEQALVAEVAGDIAEGVKNTAPDVSQQLAGSKPARDKTSQQLQAAARQPGDASKPAAAQAGKSGRQAAADLEHAAANLRRTAGKVAAELASLASEQLKPVAAAREATENTLAAANPVNAASLANLERAREKVRQARTEQLRAGGRPLAAAARQLAEEIARAVQQQRAADREAQDLQDGKASTPLAAARQQESVAALAKAIAEDKSGEIANMLEHAAAAATEAAKETLIGKPDNAQAARETARDALQQALANARQQAAEAADQPAGDPDRKSQQRVGGLARAATELVGAGTSEAEPLVEAQRLSAAAEKAIETENSAAVAAGQHKTDEALANAESRLGAAINAHRQQQVGELANQAQESGRLAEQAAAIDPGATAALRQAERAARAAGESERGADAVKRATEDVQRGLERAVASLAAREQRLRRDQNIAATLRQLAMEQQQSRDEIAQHAETLDQLSQGPDTPDKKTKTDTPAAGEAPTKADTAKALEAATQRFAEAQRATGEGAVEISRQQEVANQPIRRGLETASELGARQPQPDAPSHSGDALAKSDTPGESEGESAPSSAGEHESADTSAGEPGSGSGQSESQASQSSSSDLGSGFVPASPEVTAQQIAGDEALAQAAEALAQSSQAADSASAGESAKPGDGQQASHSADQKSDQASQSANATAGGQASEGEQADNSQPDDSQSQASTNEKRDSRGDDSGADTNLPARNFQEETWFAKLPPALQEAIRAKARRRAPRGYEERLKRYFESID